MRSTTFFIAALAVATGRVVAQDKTESTSTTTSTSASATDSAAAGIPKCVLDCTMRVASSTCGGYVQVFPIPLIVSTLSCN